MLPHPFPSTCTDFRERKRENREREKERGRRQGESKQGEAEVHGAGVARQGGDPGRGKPAGAVYGGGAWRARGRERSGQAEQGQQRCLLRHGGARRGRSGRHLPSFPVVHAQQQGRKGQGRARGERESRAEMRSGGRRGKQGSSAVRLVGAGRWRRLVAERRVSRGRIGEQGARWSRARRWRQRLRLRRPRRQGLRPGGGRGVVALTVPVHGAGSRAENRGG